jgi:hypothetical protein
MPIYLAWPGLAHTLRPLAELSLPGDRLPLAWPIPPSYSLLFKAGATLVAQINKNKFRKHKIMTTNPVRSTFTASRPRGFIKSTPVATAAASVASPAKPQTAPPSQELIAQRAYEIWLSQGQQPGCDQKHWFEAELQLQRA